MLDFNPEVEMLLDAYSNPFCSRVEDDVQDLKGYGDIAEELNFE